ncbi:hypothetical protein BDV30DRAFT_243954 [Aspergillus minisclerotigenes]|uniref:Uncharacterized protein n=1 Tax=Aspergillus minisclerotigenes TaxID=656917 RepID=A0A5N6IPL4_9EURO|nr:hypothetical protein BDV30DRAFT_243954 [Aspergillus minisclerotigenes]
MGTGLARSVCEYVDGSRCADLSYIIQSGLTLVYVAAAHYSGQVPEGLPTKRQVNGSQDYLQLWETMLSSSDDISYDSLAPLLIHPDNTTLTRRQGEPSLVQGFQITGFSVDNSPKHDIIANHYDNGDTVLHLPLPVRNDQLAHGLAVMYGAAKTKAVPNDSNQQVSSKMSHNSEDHRELLKRAILSLPSLERLDLKCDIGLESQKNPAITLRRGNVLPSLESLCLTNDSLDDDQASMWAECLQVDALRHLTLDGSISTTTKLLDHLSSPTSSVPSLTPLSVWNVKNTNAGLDTHAHESLDRFLSHITALEAFTAFDLPKSFIGHLIHRTPRVPYFEGRSLSTSDELKGMASKLPGLERLGIDLRFKEELSYDILSGVAYFPRLVLLELNTCFPSEFVNCDFRYSPHLVDSWLNLSIAEEAFRYIASAKRRHNASINDTSGSWVAFKALDIKREEWEPVAEGPIVNYSSENTEVIDLALMVETVSRHRANQKDVLHELDGLAW